MLKLVILKQVTEDIAEAFNYYESLRPGLGYRFEKELYKRFREIQRHPLHYGFLDTKRKKVFRKVMLRIFPYKIVYETGENEIVVYGVVHGHKNPIHIIKRLKG